MDFSKYHTLVSEEIRASGGDLKLLDGFSDIIVSTVLESQRNGSLKVTYLDKQGKVIFLCSSDASAAPLIGKVIRTSARKDYHKQYDSSNTVSFHLKFHKDNDADIICALRECTNKQDYIRTLIRRDLASGRKESEAHG